MNDPIQNFNNRLIGLFEKKAEEFSKYSKEHPTTAWVATQLAELYSELADLMKK